MLLFKYWILDIKYLISFPRFLKYRLELGSVVVFSEANGVIWCRNGMVLRRFICKEDAALTWVDVKSCTTVKEVALLHALNLVPAWPARNQMLIKAIVTFSSAHSKFWIILVLNKAFKVFNHHCWLLLFLLSVNNGSCSYQ